MEPLFNQAVNQYSLLELKTKMFMFTWVRIASGGKKRINKMVLNVQSDPAVTRRQIVTGSSIKVTFLLMRVRR